MPGTPRATPDDVYSSHSGATGFSNATDGTHEVPETSSDDLVALWRNAPGQISDTSIGNGEPPIDGPKIDPPNSASIDASRIMSSVAPTETERGSLTSTALESVTTHDHGYTTSIEDNVTSVATTVESPRTLSSLTGVPTGGPTNVLTGVPSSVPTSASTAPAKTGTGALTRATVKAPSTSAPLLTRATTERANNGGARTNDAGSTSIDSTTASERHPWNPSVAVATRDNEPAPFLPLSTSVRAVGPATSNTAGPSSESAPSTSLDVAELAGTISRAAFGTDGSYTLNVTMHPSELGHVQAVVSLSGDNLHVAIAAQTPTGHAALASAVDSLKSELSRGGLNVDVSLRDPESRSQRGNEEPSRSGSPDSDPETGPSGTPAEASALATSQIHLIL